MNSLDDVVLSVENLETSFFLKGGQARVVNGVSYSVRRGRTVGIVGESGCGKSVTALSIMRLLDPPGKVTGGRILFQGVDVLSLSEPEMETIRGRRMAMVFQEPMTALNPLFTIGFQLDEQIRRHRKCGRAEARARSVEMLEVVGIPSPTQRHASYPHELSGGMRQRVMIAMALSCGPELLIADEPTSALDVTIQAQVLDLIQELQEKYEMGMQFISHDLGVISDVADHVVVMYAGRVCESGPAELVFSRPRHPYTVCLLESRPSLGHRVRRLRAIPGAVPTPLRLPTGCPFQNRCSRVGEDCRTLSPEMASVGGGHAVACFHPAP